MKLGQTYRQVPGQYVATHFCAAAEFPFNSELLAHNGHDVIGKFYLQVHQLWAAGETAHLDLDTHAGKAWVGLRVNLDQVHQQPNPSRPQRRSPSYYRRQEKRRAAGATAAETSEVETRAEEASTTTVDTYEEATPAEEVSDAVVESAEKVDGDQEIEIKNAEQAPEEFFCEICDFKSKGGNGLEIHMTRKHGMI